MAWRIVLFFITVVASAQTGEGTYAVRGQVVDRFTGKPLPDVEVSLIKNDLAPVAEPVLSDEQGRFAFTGLAAGQYILGALLNHTVVYDGEYHNRPGWLDTVRTGPGIKEEPFIFRVAAPVVVSGTVRDEFGDALPRANVQLLRQHWLDGRISFDDVNDQVADDRGQFRMAGIQPGTFRLCAGADGKAAAVAGTLDFGSRNVQRAYAPVCHPGASAAFQIVPGENPTVDLKLASSSGVSVQGRVSGPQQASSATIRLVREGAPMASGAVRYDSGPQSLSFRFDAVGPGRYYLESDINQTGACWHARRAIEVGDSNVEGVSLQFEPCATVELVVHDLANRPKAAGSVKVGLRSVEAGSQELWPWAGSTGPAELQAGEYWILTRTEDEDTDTTVHCIESMKLGGRPVRDRIKVEVGAAARLEVTLSGQCATIGGRTVWQGNRAPNAMVVVLLSGSAQNPGDLFLLATGEGSDFELVGLAPGRYSVWAWPDDGGGPASLAEVESQAVVVTVGAGQKAQVAVNVIRTGGSK
jgi:hypothetical protein